MGSMGEAMQAYAKPLLEATDGSVKELETAFSVASFCWNLALTPEDGRAELLAKVQPVFKMDDDEFESYRDSVILPMVQRHVEMFPDMHRKREGLPAGANSEPPNASAASSNSRTLRVGRNAPCPCGSGKKFKRCCGR